MPSPLSYLVHFVGDIHQPLHISYSVDLGGNLFRVQYKNNATNLHSLWDDVMIDVHTSSYVEFAKELFTYIKANPDLAAKWAEGVDPTAWASESFDWVVETAYKFLPENKGSNHLHFGADKRNLEEYLEADCSYLASNTFYSSETHKFTYFPYRFPSKNDIKNQFAPP